MDDTLRYLPADRVEHRYGRLGFATVKGEDGRILGRLEGVVLNPFERKLEYLVVKTRGLFNSCLRLVPAEWPTQLDREEKALRIHSREKLTACAAVDPSSLVPFRDEDLLDTLFGRVA